MHIKIKRMKISLAEMFESLQNKKTRRKSVKHVKHNILHLKTSKIDKNAPFRAVFRFCETRETISSECGCLYSGKMHHCFAGDGGFAFAVGNWRYAQHKRGKAKGERFCKASVNRRRAVGGGRERL